VADPFLGEVKIFGFPFAPKGWALCNGQFLPINQNQALFSLLGTTYGGNGQTTFALPNLQGRTPMHFGGSHIQGEAGGAEAVTLTMSEMPAHIHLVNASSSPGDDPNPGSHVLASPLNLSYRAPDSSTALAAGTIGNVGGSQPHPNMQPFLTLSFCIALVGIFPSRN
jgi:microcystin-dependent protein